MSLSKEQRFCEITRPAFEKILSEAAEVAWIGRILLANSDKIGYLCSRFFHQFKTASSSFGVLFTSSSDKQFSCSKWFHSSSIESKTLSFLVGALVEVKEFEIEELEQGP